MGFLDAEHEQMDWSEGLVVGGCAGKKNTFRFMSVLLTGGLYLLYLR